MQIIDVKFYENCILSLDEASTYIWSNIPAYFLLVNIISTYK